MTSRTLGTGYTISVYPYPNSYGEQRWKYTVTSPTGSVIETSGGFLRQEGADWEGELAAKRAASPLYRDPGSTTAGDW